MCGQHRDVHGYLEGRFEPVSALKLLRAIEKRGTPLVSLNISNNVLVGRIFVDEVVNQQG